MDWGGPGGGRLPLRCEESHEIVKIPVTVLKVRLVGKRGSVENQRFSRNRLKPMSTSRISQRRCPKGRRIMLSSLIMMLIMLTIKLHIINYIKNHVCNNPMCLIIPCIEKNCTTATTTTVRRIITTIANSTSTTATTTTTTTTVIATKAA